MSDTNEQRDPVKEARELLAKAAPGPWFWKQNYEMPSGHKHWALTNAEEERRGRIIDASLILQLSRPSYLNRDCLTLPNWQLIARAPELLKTLCDEVDRLRKQVADLTHDFDALVKECDESEETMMRKMYGR